MLPFKWNTQHTNVKKSSHIEDSTLEYIILLESLDRKCSHTG